MEAEAFALGYTPASNWVRFVRERIQINNQPISEEKFAKYFFEVWDQLEKSATESKTPAKGPTKPVYFRYLTLIALHAYLEEGVDTAVIECGISGEYDSTNILTKPTVTSVTSLGIDHVTILSSTLLEIAWHKAGIFKPGSLAFTAPQKEEALKVLRERATERGVNLHVANIHPSLANNEVELGLLASFQKFNASIAIAVAAAHLRALGDTSVPNPTTIPNVPLPAEFVRDLEQNMAWHIDGGHTLGSIEVTGRWFAEQIAAEFTSSTPQGQEPRILIFDQQTRDANALAGALYNALQTGVGTGNEAPFTHAIFATNQTFSAGFKPDLVSINTNQQDVDALAVQKALAQTWAEIDPTAHVSVVKTIEEAVTEARAIAGQRAKRSGNDGAEVMALVTGSLHLVGGALEVLESGNMDV